MRKQFFFTLILALTLLMAIGASAPRTRGCAAGDTCKQACDNAMTACMASGKSFHQCLGDRNRCNWACSH